MRRRRCCSNACKVYVCYYVNAAGAPNTMSILCKNADCRFLIMFGDDVAGIKNDFQSEPDGMQLNMAEFS